MSVPQPFTIDELEQLCGRTRGLLAERRRAGAQLNEPDMVAMQAFLHAAARMERLLRGEARDEPFYEQPKLWGRRS